MSLNDYTKEMYERAMYEQQMSMQKNMMNTSMGNMMNSVYQQQTMPPIVPTLDDRLRAWESTQLKADKLRTEYERALHTTQVKGPTPEQMVRFPAIKEAWDELRTIMKLSGV